MTTSKPNSKRIALAATLIFGLITLWRFMVAIVLPPVQDEAYYFQWSRHLAPGYFDHPPLVAVLTQTARFSISSAAWGRLGTIAAASAAFFITLSFFRKIGLRSASEWFCALLLTNFTFAGLLFGVLATPDVALCLGWLIALHETLAFVQGDDRRALTAGIGAGLAMMGKYTGVLVVPIMLYSAWKAGLILQKRRWIALAGLAAFLIVLPNIAWNARNNWITVRYQMAHGFEMNRPETNSTVLPWPSEAVRGSTEQNLSEYFLRFEVRKPERIKPWWEKLSERTANYWGSQLGFWGFSFVPLLLALWSLFRKNDVKVRLKTKLGYNEARPLLLSATFVPLVFFGIIALFAKVEANWSIIYMITAVPLVTPLLASRIRAVVVTTLLNVVAVSGLLLASSCGILPNGKDRIKAESHGFAELARFVSSRPKPLFAETFQLVSMMKFYRPDIDVIQWPGLTRPSEFTRPGQVLTTSMDAREFSEVQKFTLLTNTLPAPGIDGFELHSLEEVRDCGYFGVRINVAAYPSLYRPLCATPIHSWYILLYESVKKNSSHT